MIVPYMRGHGTTTFLASRTPRDAQQSVMALDVLALMDALKIEKAIPQEAPRAFAGAVVDVDHL